MVAPTDEPRPVKRIPATALLAEAEKRDELLGPSAKAARPRLSRGSTSPHR
jgi:hypothetical protein